MIPHLLLSGVQGTGKTTLSLLFVSQLDIDDSDVLKLNASDENSVDVMREKIKNFVSTFGFGHLKIVQLEEADYLTPNSQAILRNIMEEYSDTTRFILTCNYENKIIPAIKSRCQQLKFKAPNRDDVSELIATILLKEKVTFDLDLLDKYVAVGYPDIRKIINLVQQYSVNGKLHQPNEQSEDSDYRFELLDCLETGDWATMRKVACGNVATEEWEDVYRFLYENLNRCKKFTKTEKWEEGIVVIAEHLHKHALVADPEINAAAMFIRLGKI